MRLRISIQRHCLPAANILWTVRSLGPAPATLGSSATISQLLEDINDIIPLENDEWGLEDYVVEVAGYECLHFQPIDSILKDDDKVTIRALLGSDLRARKDGNRHQLSSDGRHLIDGLPFGKQYLRKITRPAVPIPPRKRRKLEVAEAQYVDDYSQALILSSGDAASITQLSAQAEEEDEAEDPDFDPISQVQTVKAQEYHDKDEGAVDNDDNDDASLDGDFELVEEMVPSEELQALLDDAVSSDSAEEDQVSDRSEDATAVSGTKKRKHDVEEVEEIEFNGFSSGVEKEARFQAMKPPSSCDSDATSTSGVDSEDETKEETVSKARNEFCRLHDGIDSHDSSTTSEDTSSTDTSSESDSIGSSSSPSSPSDPSDNGAFERERKPLAGPKLEFSKALTVPPLPKPAAHIHSNHAQSAPGLGKKRTRSNNRRQRKRKLLARLKGNGVLGMNASFKDMDTLDLSSALSGNVDVTPSQGHARSVEKSRKELLEQLLAGNAEQTVERATAGDTQDTAALHPQQNVEMRSRSEAVVDVDADAQIDQRVDDAGIHKEHYSARQSAPNSNPSSTTPPIGVNLSTTETLSEPPKKRAKLDIASSRRMLFGSLGLRDPKTPAAEQAVLDKLAKPPNRHVPVTDRTASVLQVSPPVKSSSAHGHEEWADKVTLSAVECVSLNTTLPPPPFPFLQSWHYHDGRVTSRDWKRRQKQRPYDAVDRTKDEINYGDTNANQDSVLEVIEQDGAAQNQLSRELNDVPAIRVDAEIADEYVLAPEVVAGLKRLEKEDVLPGALIAFKEFEMSAKTNWSPQVSSYRTARVKGLLEDGSIDLILSQRDRVTGKKEIGKFDLPEDQGQDHDDDGHCQKSYTDLLEPRIVVPARDSSVSDSFVSTAFGDFTAPVDSQPLTSAALESAESTEPPSAQPNVQPNELSQMDIGTPRRNEIAGIIKDAGFDSALDAELLQPVDVTAVEKPSSSPGNALQTQEDYPMVLVGSYDKANNAKSSEVESRGFDSPRFNSWSSISPAKVRDDADGNEDVNEQSRLTPLIEAMTPDVGSEAATTVRYPDLSLAKLRSHSKTTTIDIPRHGSIHHGAQKISFSRGSASHSHRFDEAEYENHFGYRGGSEAGELNINDNSLMSTIPPSEPDKPEPADPSPVSSRITNPFYDGLDEHGLSGQDDDDDLPSVEEFTSTRSTHISPPPLKKSLAEEVTTRPKSISPALPSSLEEQVSDTTFKQSQSQVRLSQIPPGSHVVDLTFSSDPVSPSKSDDDYFPYQKNGKGHARKGKDGGAQSKVLVTSRGLGNRRLLKEKKFKV